MVIKYSLFLGAMIVLSTRCADDPALLNQSETRIQRCFVAVSYLAPIQMHLLQGILPSWVRPFGCLMKPVDTLQK